MMDVVEQLKFWGMQLEPPGPSISDSQIIASSSDTCPDENNCETQKIGEPLSEQSEEEVSDFCGSDENVEFTLYSGEGTTPVSGVFDDNDFGDHSYVFEKEQGKNEHKIIEQTFLSASNLQKHNLQEKSVSSIGVLKSTYSAQVANLQQKIHAEL